jgi:hypothetical protein
VAEGIDVVAIDPGQRADEDERVNAAVECKEPEEVAPGQQVEVVVGTEDGSLAMSLSPSLSGALLVAAVAKNESM